MPTASSILGAIGIYAVIILVALLRRRRRSRDSSPCKIFSSDLKNLVNLPLIYTKSSEQMTGSFSSKRKVGEEGFGIVYLGYLKDGTEVAVKKLHRQELAKEEFVNEIRILSGIRHGNLVKLLGYCTEPERLCLVYVYVSNGTLFEHLHRHKTNMPKQTRLNIAIETVTALAYLHSAAEPPVIHRDVKSKNILLENNMRVKVADFGISKILSSGTNHVSTDPKGTLGYLDLDYYSSFQLTDKSDVYSFGVVLFEVLTALKPLDYDRDSEEIGLVNLCTNRIRDGLLPAILDVDVALEESTLVSSIKNIAERCVSLKKEDRPCMTSVPLELCQLGKANVPTDV